MALRFRFRGLILPVAVSAVVLARPIAAPEVQGADKSIYVTVVDDAGKPVTGLAATDFGIREDNVIREVTGAKAATEPMSVVLLADTTSSVGENVRDIRTGATTFVRDLLGASPESAASIRLRISRRSRARAGSRSGLSSLCASRTSTPRSRSPGAGSRSSGRDARLRR